ncbi:hypothetical protein L798_09663 [Zootermopsis nevadensis]|uniref:Transposable element Tc3 transposase n=1 Tax=Zootermopsis nevadensis TaxID=136037 RepID=A0A067R073_ZOONE|nr:hypothetical protein L798_09663 [Zootermopsis nevadensis]
MCGPISMSLTIPAKTLIESYAAPQLEDMQPHMFFQQDGAPPHWGLEVRRFLNEKLPSCWIGRDGPIPWSPHCPDIFLSSYIKTAYAKNVKNITELKHRIEEILASITQDKLLNVWNEIIYRLDILRATNGAHVEVY